MSRIQIPLDLITSRLNLGERFQGLRAGPLSGRFSNLRPISEFFDFKRLSKPANFGEVQSRVNYNLSHFSSNYAVVFVMLSLYALLTNWLLMFDIILVVFGMWFIGKLDGRDLEIGSFKATSSQLYTGLLVVSIPLGLIASPFSTLLWLIGASGTAIIGHASFMDKPIDEAFSGEARVEELASDDDDEDGQGLRSRETGVVRRNQRRYDSRDEEDSSSGDSHDEDYSDDQQDEEDEWEAALVEKALYRINKAQAKGRTDVRLSKEEIKALERRQQRMEAEERRNRRRRQERVAIPLSQFGSMARLGGSESGSNPVSRQPSGSETHDEISPQMGYFPPPSGSRSRPKSTHSTSRPTSFHEEPSRDPFKYQTAGSRAAAAPKRHGSGQSDLSAMSRQGRPESVSEWSRQGSSRRQSSDDTSEDLALVEERSSRTESSSRTAKGREEIVVEVEVESPSGPERAPSRTRSTTRKKSDPAPTRRTVSSRTGTGTSGASAGVRRKKRE
ncbi:prenylated Rab acceptor 1 [Trichoderma gamsii]|uniref:Prenylated Rab acceptor 1 n=1 Tax=Trichoderma gamsii TaxID=398673 RepID=A0A2P4ZBT6_9HYPO|nr:prenylated Rab acceptor 1 [Trichoderma gamsii]PON21763.1 prenylated Rab acceptor 1 [Trichoderma gamsii]